MLLHEIRPSAAYDPFKLEPHWGGLSPVTRKHMASETKWTPKLNTTKNTLITMKKRDMLWVGGASVMASMFQPLSEKAGDMFVFKRVEHLPAILTRPYQPHLAQPAQLMRNS